MHLAFELIVMMAVVIAVAGISNRLNLSSPLLLIAVGIIGSYLPFVPHIELSPEVVLIGLLPPLLYSAALNTSLVDFNANRRSILLLSVGLVIFTTIGVGVLVHLLIPSVPLWAAFAIGAVVAPPDAVAATAIGRRIGLPRRVVTVLEGESLLNDATALVALRTAIAATVAWQMVALDFLWKAGGGVLIGLVFFVVIGKVRKQVTDPLIDAGLSFLTPFAAYLVAEEAQASGVIAVVVAGLLLGHKAPILQTAQSRISERLNWASIAFLLESAVFLLIGLQARTLVEAVTVSTLPISTIATVCLATLVAVIVLRLLWVFPARYLLVRPGADANGVRPSWRYTAVIGWAGMRGVVTLAAAFVIPPDTPHRNVLQLIAFTVAAGTLFLQGLTLPWLARRLQLPSPDPAADALARANLLHQATQEGLAVLDANPEDDPLNVDDQLRDRVRRRDLAAWETLGSRENESPSARYSRRRQTMIDAERAKVLEVRSTGTVPHEVVRDVLQMLDIEESMLTFADEDREHVASSPVRLEGDCEHLSKPAPPVEPQTPGECAACLEEGTTWVHLRMCTYCGFVGCCDSSPGLHASKHYEQTEHPVMRSAEPGEDWRWCFVDQLTG